MYTPNHFQETDPSRIHDFIESHSFATLVSTDATELVASHLPLLLDRQSGAHGRLIGHMARANPQWRSAEGQSVLAVFHGPHAYISPAWFAPTNVVPTESESVVPPESINVVPAESANVVPPESKNVVPTWNYVSVHAYGKLRLENDRQRLLAIVQRYVEFYEFDSLAPWSLEGPAPDFIDSLLDSIVGFEIDIERLEGKWKLSQNHDAQRRANVVRALREAGGDDRLRIADLMSRTLDR